MGEKSIDISMNNKMDNQINIDEFDEIDHAIIHHYKNMYKKLQSINPNYVMDENMTLEELNCMNEIIDYEDISKFEDAGANNLSEMDLMKRILKILTSPSKPLGECGMSMDFLPPDQINSFISSPSFDIFSYNVINISRQVEEQLNYDQDFDPKKRYIDYFNEFVQKISQKFQIDLFDNRGNINYPPLNDEQIEKLNTKCCEKEKMDNSCVICQENIIKDESIVTLYCNHYYHNECIIKWLSNVGVCPLCRSKIE